MDRQFTEISDENNNIKPIDSNIQEIQPIQEKGVSSNDAKQELDDDFVKSLPNWDLLPPYDMVRRVTR